MSNDHLFSADRRRSEGATDLGKALLGDLRGVAAGAMGKSMAAAHVRAAQRSSLNDIHRVASSPLVHGQRLSGYAVKAAAILDEAVQVERLPRGFLRTELGKRLEAAADGFQRPAPARERNANAATLPRGTFQSEEIRRPTFREPRTDADAFRTSGRISDGGPEARGGFDYPADGPAAPMERLFGPAANAREMNWPDADRGAPEHERRNGIDYDPARPAKGALLPSLGAIAKRSTLRKSLDAAFVHRQELGEALYRDYTAMRSHLADARRPEDWRRSDVYRDLVRRIERAPVSGVVKGELLSALAK